MRTISAQQVRHPLHRQAVDEWRAFEPWLGPLAAALGPALDHWNAPQERNSMIYFEDLEVGEETVFGSYDVTREEVIEFARKYDPQPFHLSRRGSGQDPFRADRGVGLAHHAR